ncbi:calponin-1-like isoform X1 [Engraulis encrasicolus]|uniref:calponin-1-like isoform X1 n=1 Tax=Engraulis encrasicolus TaxID=184585 RepID=UPI002FD19F34
MANNSTQFRSGPTFGLSADVKNKLAGKYDPEVEDALRLWIGEITGETLPDNFMAGLKDGVLLCKLINVLHPGSVKKINTGTQNWHQLENIGHFIRAITDYGLKPVDLFESNDLFENTNHTQVQSTLIALAGMAKSKGFQTRYDIGVKYSDKQQRRFTPDQLKEGRNVIGLQMGTNKFASQKGMTAYGTKRHLFDPKAELEHPVDKATISLQMGTNKGASQAGMTAPGTSRQVLEKNHEALEQCDTSIVSLQMGSNKGASQAGMTAPGTGRQVLDKNHEVLENCDTSIVSLQMGSNKGASQAGMTAPGMPRQVMDKNLELEGCDSSIVSLQMGSNKGASQAGMTTYGLQRQVMDNKYCGEPEDYMKNGQEPEPDMSAYQYSD